MCFVSYVLENSERERAYFKSYSTIEDRKYKTRALTMTKIAELKDKGAVVAWSPLVGEYADVIALGSKVCIIIDMVIYVCCCRDGLAFIFHDKRALQKSWGDKKVCYISSTRVDIITNILKAHIFVWSFFSFNIILCLSLSSH